MIMIINGKVRENVPSSSIPLIFSPCSATVEWRIRVPSFPLGNYPRQLLYRAREVEGFADLDGSWKNGLLIIELRRLTLYVSHIPTNPRPVWSLSLCYVGETLRSREK